MLKSLKRLTNHSEAALVGILLLVCAIFSIASPFFLRIENLFLISGQMVELGLLTIGTAVVLISGGFDLSIGALASILTVFLSIFIGILEWPIWMGMGVALAIALLFGAFNGFLCGYLKLEPMLATLATSGLISGLALGIAKADVIGINNPNFIFGSLKVGGLIPFQFIIYIVIVVIAIVIMNYTRWGRRVYMLGCNKNSAGYAGVNVKKSTFMVYVFSAFCAFIAAVVSTSRYASGKAAMLEPLVLQAVTAAVFGGISIKGGKGNIIGTVFGVITFSVISNGLNLIEVSQFLKQVITGIILLVVLAFNIMRDKQR